MSKIIKAIHGACRDLGIDDDTRHQLQMTVVGKASLRTMSTSEQLKVLDALKNRASADRPPFRRGLDGPYAKKLQALWIAGWNLGLVQNRDDAALIAFVKRQTGIDNPRWLRDPAGAAKAIEALKDWLRRDGGVSWGNTNGFDWLADHGAKIAWAQWRKLYPASSLGDTRAFAAKVNAILARQNASLGWLKAAEWRAVSNAFGVILRGGVDQ